MCPPFGSDETIMAYVMPLGWGHPPHQFKAWGAQVATEGAAVNHIARKLGEAKLRGRPLPFTDDDMATIRTFARGLAQFAEAFRILWAAQLAAKTREVDKALAGLGAKAPEP